MERGQLAKRRQLSSTTTIANAPVSTRTGGEGSAGTAFLSTAALWPQPTETSDVKALKAEPGAGSNDILIGMRACSAMTSRVTKVTPRQIIRVRFCTTAMVVSLSHRDGLVRLRLHCESRNSYPTRPWPTVSRAMARCLQTSSSRAWPSHEKLVCSSFRSRLSLQRGGRPTCSPGISYTL